MPHQTELEWAKEICKRQGYAVTGLSRINDLVVSTAISMIEWDRLKYTTSFKDHVWRGLTRQIGAKLFNDDRAVLKSEREAADTMMHIMQARVRVIRV
jgi:nucleoside phosphorylase